MRCGCYRQSRVSSVVAAATISVGRHTGVWNDNVDRFGVLTHFAADRMVAAGLPPEKVAVLPNVVEDTGVRTTLPSRSDTILYVGRLTQNKGVSTLVRAWRRRPPTDLRLRIIGAGPARDQLSAMNAPGVELIGWVDKQRVRQEMRAARALVFPSEWYEGLPTTVLEAFSCGLPVPGSKIGSLAETVGKLGNDWLIQPGDHKIWGDAFTRLLADGFVDDGARQARHRYEAACTPEAGVKRLERFYRSVM